MTPGMSFSVSRNEYLTVVGAPHDGHAICVPCLALSATVSNSYAHWWHFIAV